MGSSPIVTVGVGVAGLLGFLLWRNYRKSETREQAFHGPSRRNMLKTIAKESRSPSEYARRAEAWASSESKRPSDLTIARAYKGKSANMLKLIREAREARQHNSRVRFRSLITQPADDGLDGTPAEHEAEARNFLRSAKRNFDQRVTNRDALACSNIEHMTDVVVEASIAEISADHAGDQSTMAEATKLMHDATVKQREMVAMCRRRERALAITGQEGNLNPRRRRRQAGNLEGLGDDHDHAISIALDAAEEGDFKRADQVLVQTHAKFLRKPTRELSIAKCVRPIASDERRSAVPDYNPDTVKQALYEIMSAGPKKGRAAGSAKINHSHVIVSASKRFLSKGETAIIKGVDASSTELPDEVWPITLNWKKKPSMFGPGPLAETADFRGMFSHKDALKKAGVNYVVPCEHMTLFGKR